jgi:hypothetical protein
LENNKNMVRLSRQERIKKNKDRAVKEENIKNALMDVAAGKLSGRAAARLYGISSTVLNNRINCVTASSTKGRSPILSMATELLIVFMINKLAEWGFGLNPIDVIQIVQNYLSSTNQMELFKNGSPTLEWFYSFRGRHPDVRLRIAQNLPSDRAKASSPKIVDEFFKKVHDVYTEHNLWDRPENIFNCDESGYQADQGKLRILCDKSLKNAKRLTGNNTKQSYTVLSASSAAGQYLPPLFVFKGKPSVIFIKICNIHY